MRTDGERLVALGAVARPHGVMGEVRVHLFNPGSELLLDRETVWLRRDGEPARELTVRTARAHKGMVLLTFERVVGRDAAEALRGVEVCVPRAELPPPEEGEYYHVDLIGLRAVGPDGEPLGIISNVIPYPSVDCVVLESEAERRELPIVEPYVGAIDLAAGTVVVDHLEDFEPVRR